MTVAGTSRLVRIYADTRWTFRPRGTCFGYLEGVWNLLATSMLLLSAQPTLSAPPPQALPVIGGELVEGTAWSSVVAVYVVHSDTETGELCTGILVSPEIVLTAGHCLTSVVAADQLTLFFGPTVYTQNSAFIGTATEFGLHADYCPSSEECPWDRFDFGFIRLAEKVNGVEYIPPLIEQSEWDEAVLAEDAVVRLVGFGATREVDDSSDLEMDELGYKREVGLSIQTFSPSGYELLAGDNGRDSCNGDSGGPVFIQLADGSYRLLGITSRGVPPCGTGEGIYGVVATALPWLRDATSVDLDPACGQLGDPSCLDTTPPEEQESGCNCNYSGDERSHWLWIGFLVGGLVRRRSSRPS